MFDPKRYDTRMRDPEGKRKKPSVADPRMPKEAALRRPPEERFDAKRAEEPMPRRKKEPHARSATRTWGSLAVLGILALGVWRLTAGAVAQGLALVVLGALGGFVGGWRNRNVHDEIEAGHVAHPRRALRRPPKPKTHGRSRASVSPPPRVLAQRSGSDRPKKGASVFAIILGLSSIGTLAGAVTRGCDARRPSPAANRTVPPRVAHRIVPPRVEDWTAHLPPSAPSRISGGVLFGPTRALSRVRLSMTTRDGEPVQVETSDRGSFVLNGIGAASAVFEIQGTVDLGGDRSTSTRLHTGTRAGRVPVDTRHAFLLIADRHAGVRFHEPAVIRVAATNGLARGEGTWQPEQDVALVTGLARGGFHDVLVQARSEQLACLVERVAPGQEVVVTMRSSVGMFGRLRLPAGTAPADVEVVLTHGGLRVRAQVYDDGTFQATLLPHDSWWNVTASPWRTADATPATLGGVHAGSGREILLDLR